MRIAGLLLAVFLIAIGAMGIVATDTVVTLRRLYFATPGRFYAAGAMRMAMGAVLILAAASSGWPRILRVLGGLMCLQAVTATLLGIEHARAVMEWETLQGTTVLRAGAAVSLASGVFVAFACAKRRRLQPAGMNPSAE
jgi:hypothetical protein